MIKDLYLSQPKKRILIQKDDLKYDGDSLIVPSYWADSLLDFLDRVDTLDINPADVEDLTALKRFLGEVVDYKAEGS